VVTGKDVEVKSGKDNRRNKVWANPEDIFRVRCFHLAYKLLRDIHDNTVRFITALTQTNDDIIDLSIPRIKAGYDRWYKEFYLVNRKGWRRRHGKESK
jgi:hypothetical protein